MGNALELSVLLLGQIECDNSLPLHSRYGQWCCRWNSFHVFQQLVPEAAGETTPLPESLLQSLVHGTQDWTKVDLVTLLHDGVGRINTQTLCMWCAENPRD